MLRTVDVMYDAVDLYDQIDGDLDRIEEFSFARSRLLNS